MSNTGLWLQEYINYCNQHQRITESLLNSLVEQDRRLHSLISRQVRNSNNQRIHPDNNRPPIISTGHQTTLDPFLRTNRVPPRQMRPANRVNAQWTFNVPTTDFLRPVPITATAEQIAAATSTRIFRDITSPMNTSCPVTQIDFNPDDEVTEILHCRHLFTPSALTTWFQTNVCCPLCRYDIRNYSNNSQPQDNTTNVPSPQTQPFLTPTNHTDPFGQFPIPLDIFSHLGQIFRTLPSLPIDLSGGPIDISNGYIASYSMEEPPQDVD